MIGRTISHYRIVEKLGEGGMGVVYVAEDTVLGRRVAVKTLTKGSDNQHFRARFLREARAVSMLSHPHIATIYDYGETKDREPFIVMELINGDTLSDLITKQKMTIPRAIEIIKQVGGALAEAHRHGIIHRDIKPSNVVINQQGNVKVLDFGLAKQLDVGAAPPAGSDEWMNTQTREGVIIGTPMYLSPEQALGTDVDARSDLFALGGLLYECIAGKPPFSAGSPVEICAMIIREDPPPPSKLNPDVPPELDHVVLRALAKKREERYQAADEMIADLEGAHSRILGLDRTITRMIVPGHPHLPTGAMATLSDIFRRPRLPIGYVVAGVLAAGLVAAVIWYLASGRVYHPRQEAEQFFNSGTNSIREGLYFQATKALDLATRADDKFALAHARLAEALAELDYYDRAKDEIVSASELTRRSVLSHVDALYLDAVTATVRRNFSAAVATYSQIAQLESDKAEVHVDLGRAYEKNDQSDKAIESYLNAIKRDSQSASAYLRLGVLYARKREMDESKKAFDKAEEIYESRGNVEGRTEVALQRGVVLNDLLDKPDDARPILEQAREMARVTNGPYQQIRVLYQLSSVARKQRKGSEAKQFALQALELAQSNRMDTLIARGFIEVGIIDFSLDDNYQQAEHNFEQGLEFAQKFGARFTEARAKMLFASLYEQTGQPDRALPFQEQALAFYQSAGYRTEANQAMNLRGRLYRQKGDFNAALQAFQDQLKFAEQTADQANTALGHTSIGNLLSDQEQYADALAHFEKSFEIYRSLNNQLNLGYVFVSRGLAHWRLGHREQAAADLKQASEMAKSSTGKFKALVALAESQIALSDQLYGEVIEKSQQALEAAGPQDKSVNVRGKYLTGLARALSERGRAGQMLCEEAVGNATPLGDPLLLARAQLALAEAALVAGDQQRAIAAAQQSRAFFNRVGLAESEWRAWVIEGRATGDREGAKACFARATDLLASLERKWGAEVYASYRKRRDIQALSRDLGN